MRDMQTWSHAPRYAINWLMAEKPRGVSTFSACEAAHPSQARANNKYPHESAILIFYRRRAAAGPAGSNSARGVAARTPK